MNKFNKKLINEIVDIAQGVKKNKKLFLNINNHLGCVRYIDDCRFITRNIEKDAKILDLGCGVGHMSYILAKQGYDVTASEIFEDIPIYIDIYNESNKSKIPYLPANILEENHKLIGMKFDAVVICGVLEHVPDMSLFLQKIFHILKPGGKLFIQQFPNKYSLFEKINDYRKKSSHDIRLSKYELSLLVAFSTFKLHKIGYHQFLPYALNGFPKIVRAFYYGIEPLVRLVDKFLYKFPIINMFSTSIQLVCSKSTSCKS